MIDLNELKKLAEAATPGPWERDTIRSDGEYGTDDDGGFGFDTYEVTDNTGQCIMDCLNNDNGCVEVGHDGHAWDEVAKHNAAFVAAANPAVILELVALASKAAQDSAPAELPDGWLIDGSLVYKLDPTGSMNAFEINVTMADGSRKPEGPRVDLAKKILAWLAAAPASPQPVAKVLTAWEYFFIHEGTTAAAPMEIGPCITYDKEQAFGIGCIKQREVSILAASTPTTAKGEKE